jgi:hypothetical protein
MHALADTDPAPLPRLAAVADMRPCTRCGRVDRRRMVALMTLWFGHYVGVPLDHGYFYLCPDCYDRILRPALLSASEDHAD